MIISEHTTQVVSTELIPTIINDALIRVLSQTRVHTNYYRLLLFLT